MIDTAKKYHEYSLLIRNSATSKHEKQGYLNEIYVLLTHCSEEKKKAIFGATQSMNEQVILSELSTKMPDSVLPAFNILITT